MQAEAAEDPQTQLRRALLQGPVRFLRDRQRSNAGQFILSPIKASKQRLETAMKALEAQNVYDPDPLIYKTALSLVRSASLNCYIFPASEGDTIETKMSLLQGQLGIGDACTFRLIEKNVVSLLPLQKEELRKDAANALTDLIRSYRRLDDILNRAYGGDVFAAEEAVNSLQYTMASTASFQNIIERCLDMYSSRSQNAVVG
ncbi:g41 [Coccomyxa elongata]